MEVVSEADDSSLPVDYRFILLGASNLTLGLPRIVRCLRQSLSGRIEIIAAHGHGRSYMNWSHVLIRGLPAISKCDLWTALAERPPARKTYALITDLGCDLFYGQRPEPLIETVGGCMDRLSAMGAELIFARPPLKRLNRLSSWEYYVAKNVFFPGPTPPWSQIRADIQEVDRAVHEKTSASGGVSFSPKEDWFGLDPIHIKQNSRAQAWLEILSNWGFADELQMCTASISEHLHIWRGRPAQRKFWWRPQSQQQPVLEWGNDTSLWIY